MATPETPGTPGTPVGPVTAAHGRARGGRGRRVRDVVTPFRVFCTVALTAAALLTVFGFQGSVDQRAATCNAGPIVQLYPCPGDSDLRQGIIGASLASGYQVALIVDRTEIPLDQLRTGGINQVYFQPGPGTETGALAPGLHSATIVYWPATGTREHDGKPFSWVFSTT
jgi:hypothetical protein